MKKYYIRFKGESSYEAIKAASDCFSTVREAFEEALTTTNPGGFSIIDQDGTVIQVLHDAYSKPQSEIQSELPTHKDSLELIQNQLIELIKITTHYGALEGLTKALCQVSQIKNCLKNDYFFGQDVKA